MAEAVPATRRGLPFVTAYCLGGLSGLHASAAVKRNRAVGRRMSWSICPGNRAQSSVTQRNARGLRLRRPRPALLRQAAQAGPAASQALPRYSRERERVIV